MSINDRVPERDLDLKFLNEYVYPCKEDGWCGRHDEWRTDPDDGGFAELRCTKRGDNRNWWRTSDRSGGLSATLSFRACIGCLHPIGHRETRRVNDYFGYKLPSLADLLAELDDGGDY